MITKVQLWVKTNGMCPICNKLMLNGRNFDPYIFPKEYPLVKQMEEHGLEFSSDIYMNYRLICTECKRNIKEEFECFKCRKVQLKSEVEYTYEKESLCRTCYSTVTAKQWDRLKEAMEESERDRVEGIEE